MSSALRRLEEGWRNEGRALGRLRSAGRSHRLGTARPQCGCGRGCGDGRLCPSRPLRHAPVARKASSAWRRLWRDNKVGSVATTRAWRAGGGGAQQVEVGHRHGVDEGSGARRSAAWPAELGVGRASGRRRAAAAVGYGGRSGGRSLLYGASYGWRGTADGGDLREARQGTRVRIRVGTRAGARARGPEWRRWLSLGAALLGFAGGAWLLG